MSQGEANRPSGHRRSPARRPGWRGVGRVLLSLTSHHTFVLGVVVAAGGFAAAIRGLLDGDGVLGVLTLTGAALAGTALACASIIQFGRRERRR
ncbi:hypothetical protein E0L36_21145 [Streptomyces sp. AJS327]|uniref:hypothetical protein n=1 Tax=Streptomyces sp. AJS327 TaxID=2545265 RepID=UPI0015DF5C76|nr:hypothetical protein [Streptomyces sp. AJS327]MBA0053288.1 hypothetical protein [Streptomyces sp. AJS327]